MTISTTEDLLAVHAIHQLKAGYCRFVDTKQWRRLQALFLPTAQIFGLVSAPDGSDPAAFVAGISKNLAAAVSVHHVHTPEMAMQGPDQARAVWAMYDLVQFPAGDRPGWSGYGFYEEEYTRTDAGWRIATMRLTRLRMETVPADAPTPQPGRLAPTPDWI